MKITSKTSDDLKAGIMYERMYGFGFLKGFFTAFILMVIIIGVLTFIYS